VKEIMKLNIAAVVVEVEGGGYGGLWWLWRLKMKLVRGERKLLEKRENREKISYEFFMILCKMNE
jgi:hypothetical protein